MADIREKLQKSFDQATEAVRKANEQPLPEDELTDRQKAHLRNINPKDPQYIPPQVLDAVPPPCANWSVWIGHEIEGTADRDELTMFVRSLQDRAFLEFVDEAKNRGVERVFFTEEFINWAVIRDALIMFPKVCKAVLVDTFYIPVPADIVHRCRMYFKFRFPKELHAKDGDQICAGIVYHEQIWEWKTDLGVKPADYDKDIQIL